MTDREESHFNSRFDKLDNAIEEIRRGVYGDIPNKVPGLIADRRQDHELLMKHEEIKKKAIWWGAGFIVAIELVWHSVKHKFGL